MPRSSNESRFVTLAVLSWENLSDLPSDKGLLLGFVSDIISELARFPSFGVIGPDSVTEAERSTTSEVELAEKLGAQYLLKGSFRRWDETLRINTQLVEVEGGRHVWAGRYDGADLPAVHDEITGKIVNALVAKVDQAVLLASRSRRPSTLQAYECWLRGIECLQRGTAEFDEEGRQFFEQAMDSDPHYARAAVGVSLSHFNEWSCQTWEKWGESETKAYEAACHAERLDPDDAVAQMILGRIEQYRRSFDTALRRFERALELAPNDSLLLLQLAGCFTYHGDPERGWEMAQKAMRLNPLGPSWAPAYVALPLFSLRRFEEALEQGARCPPQSIVDTPAYKAAAAAHLDRMDEAARYLEDFREDFANRIQPCGGGSASPEELLHWTLHINPYRRSEDRQLLEEGLRKAGLGNESPAATSSGPMNWSISNTFRMEGKLWTLAYKGQVVAMPDLRGLHDIAQLLPKPGEEISCTDLADAKIQEAGVEQTDARALSAYRERLAELEEELETANAAGDVARATQIEEEREGILEELKRSTGLGGRVRKTKGVNEKARTAVTWRIRHAIRKVEDLHPELGRHLANSIKTGAFCVYQPESPTSWH